MQLLCIALFLILIGTALLRGYGIGDVYSDHNDDLDDEMYMIDTFYQD